MLRAVWMYSWKCYKETYLKQYLQSQAIRLYSVLACDNLKIEYDNFKIE